MLADSRTERDALTTRLQELEHRSAERSKQWHMELAEAFGPLRETSARIERLLNGHASLPAASDEGWRDQPAQPKDVPVEAADDAESGEETTWRF